MKKLLKIAGSGFFVLLLLLIAYVVIDPHNFYLPMSSWGKVKEGMSEAEVEKLLGSPHVKRSDEWSYHPFNDVINSYYVQFDGKGRVTWKYTLD